MFLRLRLENIDSLPDGGPTSFEVARRGLDIGRDSYLDWTLPDPERFISGKHCEIRYRDGGYWLHDVSTNGTSLNGQGGRLTEPHLLQSGDRIHIGHYIIAVEVMLDDGAGADQGAAEQAGADFGAQDPWGVENAAAAIDRRDFSIHSQSGRAEAARGPTDLSEENISWSVGEVTPGQAASDGDIWGTPASGSGGAADDWGWAPPPATEPAEPPAVSPAAPPVTPDPAASDFISPDPVAPDPVAPDPVAADGAAPGPAMPGASSPEAEPSDMAAPFSDSAPSPTPASKHGSAGDEADPFLSPAMAEPVPASPDETGNAAPWGPEGGAADPEAPGSEALMPEAREPEADERDIAATPPDMPADRQARPAFDAASSTGPEAEGSDPFSTAGAGAARAAPHADARSGGGLAGRWASGAEPAEPPAISEGSVPAHPAEEVRAGDEDRSGGHAFIAAFERGAGIPAGSVASTGEAAFAEELGALFKLVTQNLQMLLAARAETKSAMRSADRTMIGALENNPLKFSPTAEDALRIMFGAKTRSYLDAVETMEASFRDLQQHQVQTFAAMQQALQALIEDLDPASIEEATATEGGLAGIVGSRRARLWDTYVERFRAKSARHERGMIDSFMILFAEMYDRQR